MTPEELAAYRKGAEDMRREKVKKFSMPEPNSGCWLWIGTASENRSGMLYGMVRDGKMRRANRYAYEAFKGPIQNGLMVRHTCDNPLCVNPDHLITGTCKDNVKDRYDRARDNHAKGDHHGNAKLTEADVREIRKRIKQGISRRSIAAEFGVSTCPVNLIAWGKAWSHVHD